MRDQKSCQFERRYPISELNYNHLKNKTLFSVYDDSIFPFYREFNVFFIEYFKIISNLGQQHLQGMSCMTKHVGKAH